MHTPLRRARLFLPLALLLAVLFLSGTHATRAATTTVSFSIDPLPRRTYYADGNPHSTAIAVALAKRSGTATLTPGVAQIVQTTGSIHDAVLYNDEPYVVDTTDTFTRTFSVDGMSHPQTQAASISGDGGDPGAGDEGGYDGHITLDLDAGPTVTYDLGAKGKVDVTPLAVHYYNDYEVNPESAQPPLQYRLLLHDVPGLIAVKQVLVSPGAVYGGATTFGKVSLASPAPAGGATVGLMLSPAGAASVPSTVTVPAGRTFVTFPITTSASSSFSADTLVTLSASVGGAGQSALFTVLTRYSFSGSIDSNNGQYGLDNVTVTAKATGTFTLTSTSTPAASIPDNSTTGVTSTLVPKGTGTISGLVVGLDITHPRISDLVISLQGPDGTTVFLQNKTGGTQKNLQTSYPVLNAPVDSLSAFTGKNVQGTWKLTIKDAKGGSVGTLNAWNLTFTYDGTVVGTSTGTDNIYAVTDLKEGTYTVTPSRTGVTFLPASRTVTVGPDGSPPNPTNVDFDFGPAVVRIEFPYYIYPGGTTLTGTVRLNKPAPSGGVPVTLSSSFPSSATVPASVTVAAGQTTATFTVQTHPPSPEENGITITAAGGGNSVNFNLLLDGGLAKLSVSPASVPGGTKATGTITLTSDAFESVKVMLSSSNPGAASVPSSVTVAEFGKSATFAITTHAVGTSTPVTITATLAGVEKTTSLTVTP